jgi:hypothetical protein
LVERGAKVVVNDFGYTRPGTGSSPEPADSVVVEVAVAGGAAIATTTTSPFQLAPTP